VFIVKIGEGEMQGKKSTIVMVSVLFIIMFMVTDLNTIQVFSDMNRQSEYLNIVKNHVEADIGPPRAAFSLADLVEDLMAVTTDTTDTDLDGLVDSIEAIIGTDSTNNDTDFDKVRDDFEVWNGTDPLEPDSNFDGLPDFFELEVANPDVDGDGVDNAWDFDNDNDGVNDEADLSPFCYSDVQSSFSFEILTDGNPTYFTIQLRPRDPSHLKLFYQYWDWPYDDQGLMRDLDYSKEDVRAIPQLNVTTENPPDQLEVSDYGILVTETGYHVPLTPVWDKGDLVAFECKIFIPQSTQTSTIIDTEMFWRIMGNTDIGAIALLASNGMYVVLGDNSLALADGDAVSGALQWIEFGDGNVTLKFLNGNYMSLLNDGRIGAARNLDNNAKFSVTEYDDERILRANNGLYITLDNSGVLVANGSEESEAERFQLVDLGHKSEWTSLVTYPEPFMLTGIEVEENFESHLGLYYSSTKDPIFAANLLMTYEFMRNGTNLFTDQPSILTNFGIDVEHLFESFPHRDLAFKDMSNELLPAVLSSLPVGETLPVVIAHEDHTRVLEMSEVIPDVKTTNDAFVFDVRGYQVLSVRTLKMNFYNTSDFRALALDDALSEVVSWNLEGTATFNALLMVMKWFTGEQLVTSIDDVPVCFQKPPDAAMDIVQTIVISELEGLAAISELMWIHQAFKEMKVLQKGGFTFNSAVRSITLESKTVIGAWAKTSRNLEKLNKGFNKAFKSFQRFLAIAGIIMDVGIAIYSAILLANSIGGRVGDEVGAVYGVTASMVAIIGAVLLLAIGEIPYVGWLIALALVIADLIGGYSDKLISWLSTVIFGEQEDLMRVEPNIEIIGTPSARTIDPDGNGLDIGDTIEVLVRFRGMVNDTLGYAIPLSSYMRPYVDLYVPQGNVSRSGYPAYEDMDVDYALCWKTETYDSYAWATPALPMVNYPVWAFLKYDYHLRYKWRHLVMGFVYCYHDDWNDGSNSTSLTIYHFDVMPATIDDFVRWGAIKLLDSDGDELKDSEESLTDAWKYDSDGDDLRDNFEIEYGLDPTSYDSDEDGLNDKWELVYGTDATMRDSDLDGLPDYTEIAGWNIEFNYTQTEGSMIIPFTTHVYSDPRNNDSDNDGIDDFIEYQSRLNPQSQDTDGDSIPDQPAPETETVVEEIWKRSLAPTLGFDIDSQSRIHYGATSNSFVWRINTAGTEDLHYGDGKLTLPVTIAIDNQDRVYVQDQNVADAESKIMVPTGNLYADPVIALSQDGNTMAIGSKWERAVWIYTREDNSWTLRQTLRSTVVGNDYFGYSLALSADGNILIVGAPEQDLDYYDNGIVYVYVRSGNVWVFSTFITPPRTMACYFGGSLSLSYNGDYLVIGESNSRWFHVYLYYNQKWNHIYSAQTLDAGYYVRSIAVNRQTATIVVGAEEPFYDQGAAYVYELQSSGIFTAFRLTAPDRLPRDQFGFDVAISEPSENTIIVGAPQDGVGPGAVYVFEKDGAADWSQSSIRRSTLSAPDGHINYLFGASVSLSPIGNTILVGSPGRGTGAAFAYRKINSNWFPLSWIEPMMESDHTKFGIDIAMDSTGTRFIVGARQSFYTQPVPIFEFLQSADRIVRFDTDGNSAMVFLSRIGYGSPQLPTMFGMAVDSNGYIYLSYDDTVFSGVRKYSPSGTLVGFIGGGWLVDPYGIEIDSEGNILVADKGLNDVLKFSPSGDLMPTPWSGFLEPEAVAVDSKGNVYIADTGNDLVQIFDENGIAITSFSFYSPIALQIDSEDNLFVINQNNIGKYRLLEVVVEVEPPTDVSDWDEDGLTNDVETTGWEISYESSSGTYNIHVTSNPNIVDSDLDGLSDLQEWELGTNPSSGDTDKDALDDLFEWQNGLNPSSYDTDGELLDDSTELTFGSNPFLQDTDADGTDDYFEFLHGTNPCSADTDKDGATDTEELNAGTDPLSPDSDQDFVFDGAELDKGTDPNSGDSDNDFIDDGLEGIIGTNPLSNDTDGDNISDFVEISLSLDPLSNDTDGDNIPDNIELIQGTNPRNNDTDNDGVPDNLDPDSSSEVKGEIILVCDNLNDPGLAAFANRLVSYHHANIIGLDDFLANYTNEPWIILVGNPASEPGTVGNLIYTLLADSPDVLQTMVESGGNHIAVRYGVWNETQTIVMLSQAASQDVYPVLQALKEKNVTMDDGALIVEFPLLTNTEHIVNIMLSLDDIDMVKMTDSELMISLSEPAQPTIKIGLYNETTTPVQLSNSNGLDVYSYAMGKYLEIDFSVEGFDEAPVDSAMIRIYYKELELDLTGNGLVNDTDDFNETTLVLYYYNEVLEQWIELNEGLDWVIATGVNTNDLYLFGEVYAGYVWAQVTHLSLFGIAGQTHNRPPDVSGAYPSIEFIWPPNGKFVEVSIEGVTDPDGDDVTITIMNITSDEFVGWDPDAFGVGCDTAWLRAERDGFGNGRVYEITFLASDGRGGETIGSVFVYVPHNKKKCSYVMPIDDGQKYDATKGWRPRWWHWRWWHGYGYSHHKQKC